MALSVLIIDCTGKAFNSANHTQLALGGIERAVVQLAEHFVRKGLTVSVWNNTPEPVTAAGVSWIPKNRPDLLVRYDIVIACNDACLFSEYARASGHENFTPYIWFHNRVMLGKTLRKGRMFPILRWRPVGVFLGQDHESTCPKIIPFRRRAIIGHGVENEVLNYDLSGAQQNRPPVAAFISQPYRGLRELIPLWMSEIHPAVPEARLRIYATELENCITNKSKQELAETGIELRGRLPRRQLMQDLEEARACLIPGHIDETFCLAAAEASALHIPVLTYGTGSLHERVANDRNGFIVANKNEFSTRLKQILTDDALWHRLSAHGMPQKSAYSWDAAADRWLRLFQESA